jgi:hypothetical protein
MKGNILAAAERAGAALVVDFRLIGAAIADALRTLLPSRIGSAEALVAAGPAGQ